MVRMIPRVIPRMIQVVNQEYSLLVRLAVSAVVIIPATALGHSAGRSFDQGRRFIPTWFGLREPTPIAPVVMP